MPPTRAEISRELGFKSPNAAEEHLKALARKGAIEIVAGASRGIRIIDDSAMMRKKKAYRSLVAWPLGSQFWQNNILKALIVLMLICLSLKLISY